MYYYYYLIKTPSLSYDHYCTSIFSTYLRLELCSAHVSLFIRLILTYVRGVLAYLGNPLRCTLLRTQLNQAKEWLLKRDQGSDQVRHHLHSPNLPTACFSIGDLLLRRFFRDTVMPTSRAPTTCCGTTHPYTIKRQKHPTAHSSAVKRKSGDVQSLAWRPSG